MNKIKFLNEYIVNKFKIDILKTGLYDENFFGYKLNFEVIDVEEMFLDLIEKKIINYSEVKNIGYDLLTLKNFSKFIHMDGRDRKGV